MDNLIKFQNIKGKSESLLTVIVWDYNKGELENLVKKKLDLIKKIKDTVKRKMINDRLYNFLTFLEKEGSTLNNIYLVDDDVESYKLSKKEISTLKKYGIRNLYYENDDHFKIDYIIKLFTDFTFFKVGELNNKKLCIEEINSTKRLTLENKNISNQSELLDVSKNLDLLHGVSSMLKSLNSVVSTFNKKLSRDEILDEINKVIMKDNHKRLQNLIDNILNPSYDGKIFMGKKETDKFYDMYAIKNLFIYEKDYDEFIKNKEDINFEVTKIEELSVGDVGSTLSKSYGNFIGELYYAMS